MDRDTQIKLMNGAAERVQRIASAWLKDDGVRASIKRNAKDVQEMKRENRKVRACV